MRIEILYSHGCPNHEAAELLVREVLGDVGCRARIVSIAVPDDSMAARVKFPGSPTIRVDGNDIDPAGATGPFALSCRLYRTNGGVAGVPDRDAIRAAILRREEP